MSSGAIATSTLRELDDDLTDMVPGTERELFPPDSLMGEGSHFYKINGKYIHHQRVVGRPYAHGGGTGRQADGPL
jgi:xylan 1,4-beta-xylosidase